MNTPLFWLQIAYVRIAAKAERGVDINTRNWWTNSSQLTGQGKIYRRHGNCREPRNNDATTIYGHKLAMIAHTNECAQPLWL